VGLVPGEIALVPLENNMPKNRDLLQLFPSMGSGAKKERKPKEGKEKRVFQHSIFQSYFERF